MKIPDKQINIVFLIYLSFFIFFSSISSKIFSQTISDYELIINGDFSQGNTGFTTDYRYRSTNLKPPGYYTVSTNPYLAYDGFDSCADHTTLNGEMMIVNGSEESGWTVWLQDIEKISIFLSPLSSAEIRELKHRGNDFFRTTYIKMMRQKLLRRAKKQNLFLSPQLLANLRQRADDAFKELADACYFDYIIPNKDGEDSNHWDNPAFPEGDAGQALATFYAILKGNHHPLIEHWNKDFVSWRV